MANIPDPKQRDRDSLDRTLVQGVAWTSGVKWLVQGITWTTTIIIARLLTPEDYGLVGMAGLFLGFVGLLSQFGISAAVINMRELTQNQVAQLYGAALMIGVVAMGLTVAGARPLAEFFEAPRLTNVVLALSITFLFSSVSAVPMGTLRRDLQYRTLALIEGGKSLAGAALTLLLAALGFGYWSLVLGRIGDLLIHSSVVMVITGQKMAWPRLREIREAAAFSSHVLVSRVSWFTYSNADYLIIGKLMGQQALGVYTFAFTLARMPAEKIGNMVTRVTPGIFSAVQDDTAELRRYLLNLTEAISITTFPAILGLGLVAGEFVPVVLGEQWAGAIVPLQILSVGAVLRAVSSLLPQILNVTRETRFGMQVGIAAAIAFSAGFLYASRWGVVGIAVAWVVLDPIVTAAPTFWKIRQRIGLTVAAYFRALWPAVSSSASMAAAVLAARLTLEARVSPPVLLAAEVTAGAVAYATTLLLLHGARARRMLKALNLLRS